MIHKAINVQHSHGHIQCHDNEILLFSSQLIESLDWKNTNYSNTEETMNYIEVASGQILGQDKRPNGRSTPTISDSYGKLSEFSQPSYFKIDLIPNIYMGVRNNVFSCLKKQLFPGRQVMTLAAVRRSSFLWYRLLLRNALFRKVCWPWGKRQP